MIPRSSSSMRASRLSFALVFRIPLTEMSRMVTPCPRSRKRILEMWDEFQKEATSGDYKHLLTTIMDWFDVDLFEDEDEDEYDFDCEDDED